MWGLNKCFLKLMIRNFSKRSDCIVSFGFTRDTAMLSSTLHPVTYASIWSESFETKFHFPQESHMQNFSLPYILMIQLHGFDVIKTNYWME